jgi:RNA polymerase sigma-70 factor (ECF subfamily)
VERVRAFEDFYRAHRETILRAVVFALEDADLALEATDEAMARAHERWDDVAAMSNPMGWVFRVAVNVVRNRLRRRGVERRHAKPPDRDWADIEGVGDPTVAESGDGVGWERTESVTGTIALDGAPTEALRT